MSKQQVGGHFLLITLVLWFLQALVSLCAVDVILFSSTYYTVITKFKIRVATNNEYYEGQLPVTYKMFVREILLT